MTARPHGGPHAGAQPPAPSGGQEGGHGEPEEGLKPRERSAALPAATTADPPHPLIAPTGNVPFDAVAALVNRTAEPWQDLPNQTGLQKAATIVNGVLGIINFDVLVDAVNLGVAAFFNMIPWPSLPAATIGMPHIGLPHLHTHPPALF